MYQCKSGSHWWLHEEDAAKCCNGWRRILVLGGGQNQQACAGVQLGRRWVKSAPVDENGALDGTDENAR